MYEGPHSLSSVKKEWMKTLLKGFLSVIPAERKTAFDMAEEIGFFD